MRLLSIDCVIEILDLLSMCVNIESVIIKFKDLSSTEGASTKETIAKVKNGFLKKVGITCEVNILRDRKVK